MKNILLLLLITACSEAQIDKKKMFFLLNKGSYAPQNLIEKINSYRSSPSLGASDNVYLQKVSGELRVFMPINYEWAQFYSLAEEVSATDDLYSFAGDRGLMKYYRVAKPDSTTGVFTGGHTGYTSELNATATITFNGTGLDYVSLQNTGGGKWEYVLDGGSPVEFSVWRATEAYVKQNLFNNIPFGEHTVVLTYKGRLPETVSGAEHGRGWFGRGGTGTNHSLFFDAFWIIGSDEPNLCYDVNLTGSYLIGDEDKFYTTGTHNEFALSVEGDPSTAGQKNWIPNHETVGKASVFSDLANDRTLKFDGVGTNYLTYSWPADYNFAITDGNSLVLRQVFKGVNKDDDDLYLWDVIDIQTVDKTGIDYNETWTSLFQHIASTGYPTMFGIRTQTPTNLFTHLLTHGNEIDYATEIFDQEIIAREELPNWNGSAIYVAKTGSDLIKSVAWGFQQSEVYNSMNLANNYNQSVFWSVVTGSLHKLYPTLFEGYNLPAGVTFSWNTKMTMGFVPEAYTTLKGYAGL